MGCKTGPCLLAACLFGSLVLARPLESVQQKSDEFGSSLRNLKWDRKKQTGEGTQKKQAGAPTKDKSAPQEESEAVRLETVLVLFDVLVLDKSGKSIVGFNKNDFVVIEDGQPQQVSIFSLGDGAELPRSIVLIIDHSGSQYPYIRNSVDAAKTLVDKLGPKDRLAIVTDDVELLIDFTQDKNALKAALESLAVAKPAPEEFGKSEQFSAMMATLKELLSEETLPIIIFQTDGDQVSMLQPVAPDAPSIIKSRAAQFSLADVYAAAERSRATIYSIIPGQQLIGLSEEALLRAGHSILKSESQAWSMFNPDTEEVWRSRFKGREYPDEYVRLFCQVRLRQHLAVYGIAKQAGGWTEYLETPDKAAEIYNRIFAHMNRRYVIGYYPTNTARDGKLRKVEIKVRDHPEYVVWGRKSYYAPGANR